MLNALRGLAVFAKTAELGSFRAAASALQISPSVVSHHISQLEETLGVTLLYRSTRSLSLTGDGERLFGAAQAMVNAAEEGINAARDHAHELSGELRITAPAILAPSLLADRIAQFLKAHPNVTIAMDYSDTPRDMVSEGIDVAIRMGWLRDSALKARKLYSIERVVMASRSYLTGRTKPATPKDIEKWDWLELASVPLKPMFQHSRRKSVRIRPQARLSANSANALYALMLRGAGLAILPRFLATSDLKDGQVELVLEDWKLPSVSVYAMRPQNAPRRGLAAEFVAAIAN